MELKKLEITHVEIYGVKVGYIYFDDIPETFFSSRDTAEAEATIMEKHMDEDSMEATSKIRTLLAEQATDGRVFLNGEEIKINK